MYDEVTGLAWWFYPSGTGGGTIDHWITYNIRTQKWGAGSLTVQMCGTTSTAQITYAALWASLTYDAIPSTTTYDSPLWTASSDFPAVFGSDHKLAYLTGAAGTGTLTFATLGDEQQFSTLRRFQPRWVQQPTSATVTHSYAPSIGTTYTAKTAVNMASARFDLFQSSRWHKLTLSTVGDTEFDGLNYDLVPGGRE